MALIDELIRDGYLKTPEIIRAFRKIKREDFLRARDRDRGEINAPLSIGRGQTISQPLTVAFMLELLEPFSGGKILDVGSGSGWTSALLAEIGGENGKVFAIEAIPGLKEYGEKNAGKYNFLKDKRLKFLIGDGWQGLPVRAPFDRILVSAAAPEAPPALLEQLKIGGRMVVPVGERFGGQDIMAITRLDDNKYGEERFPGFVFVPLVKCL